MYFSVEDTHIYMRAGTHTHTHTHTHSDTVHTDAQAEDKRLCSLFHPEMKKKACSHPNEGKFD